MGHSQMVGRIHVLASADYDAWLSRHGVDTGSVGTSSRGGTVHFLHVSELGKIARKYPERAEEIVTGAFESVPVAIGEDLMRYDAAARRGLHVGLLPTWGDKFNKKWGTGPEIFTPAPSSFWPFVPMREPITSVRACSIC